MRNPFRGWLQTHSLLTYVVITRMKHTLSYQLSTEESGLHSTVGCALQAEGSLWSVPGLFSSPEDQGEMDQCTCSSHSPQDKDIGSLLSPGCSCGIRMVAEEPGGSEFQDSQMECVCVSTELPGGTHQMKAPSL